MLLKFFSLHYSRVGIVQEQAMNKKPSWFETDFNNARLRHHGSKCCRALGVEAALRLLCDGGGRAVLRAH